MSFLAKLQVGGKEYTVIHACYDLAQETDATGRPSSITRGGRIFLEVESTGASDLFEWMTSSFERKNGTIKYYKIDSDSTLKELKFYEAYMVKYKENFNASGTTPLTETFTLSSKKIAMGGGEFDNNWV